jgi:ketosteroid isomerase-like protein
MSDYPANEHIELVRRFNEAIVARDPDAFALLTADFVYRPIATFADIEERRGPDQFQRFMLDWWDLWQEGANWRLETIRAYGDAVVALLRFSGRARASGVETLGGVFQVFRFRDGRIEAIEDYTDSQDAIAAAERT